jgi:hypothetical protein
MKKIILLIAIAALSKPILYAQNLNNTSAIEKTGWLVYKDGHVIWFESNLKKTSKNIFFFDQAEYPNGLIVDYISVAKFYKSIAECYFVKDLLQIDSVTKKADYTLSDSICVLPVKIKFTNLSRPVSELLRPMGLSFVRGNNEVTITYNFETNYELNEIELLRKKDKKRIKKVKNYVVTPN